MNHPYNTIKVGCYQLLLTKCGGDGRSTEVSGVHPCFRVDFSGEGSFQLS